MQACKGVAVSLMFKSSPKATNSRVEGVVHPIQTGTAQQRNIYPNSGKLGIGATDSDDRVPVSGFILCMCVLVTVSYLHS